MAFIAITSFFIYSCSKDNLKENLQSDQLVEVNLKAEKYLNSISNNIIVELRTDSIIGCFNGTVNGTPCASPPQPKIDTIVMPGYGNCQAVVTWDQYWCPGTISGGNLGTIVFDNFSAAPLDGSCDSVVLEWLNLVNNGNLTKFESDLITFNLVAENELKDIVMSNLGQLYAPFINCQGNNLLLYSNFYKSTCAKTCYKVVIQKGIPKFSFVQKRCGESCCKETTGYCWNSFTNSLQVSNTTKASIGLCTEEKETVCPNGFFPLSKFCERPCL